MNTFILIELLDPFALVCCPPSLRVHFCDRLPLLPVWVLL